MSPVTALAASAVVLTTGVSYVAEEALPAPEPATLAIKTTKEKAELCAKEGCALITKKDLYDLIEGAISAGRKEVEDTLDSNGCKVGRT